MSEKPRAHIWVSSRAFTAITGVKKVCMDCGQTDLTAAKVCPGPDAPRSNHSRSTPDHDGDDR